MAMVALVLTLVAGWLGWSGWLAIPFGVLLWWTSRRAIPNDAHRVDRLGVPVYAIGAFLLMKLAGWIHTLLA
jgi:hypothetical protein